MEYAVYLKSSKSFELPISNAIVSQHKTEQEARECAIRIENGVNELHREKGIEGLPILALGICKLNPIITPII